MNLEVEPSALEQMFYETAVYLHEEENTVLIPEHKILQQNWKLGLIEPDEYYALNLEQQQAIDEVRKTRYKLAEYLPPELKEGAYYLFSLLPYIQDAVSEIKSGKQEGLIKSRRGEEHEFTDTLRQALLIAARGTGYALKARVANGGYVIASPYMELIDVVFRLPAHTTGG